MQSLFLLGTAWLLYVYVGYPLMLWLIGFVRAIHPSTGDDLPRVSVLIAARNEEKDIRWKIQQTLSWNYPAGKLQILVASDSSEDMTDSILQSIQDPRLIVVRMTSRVGKNAALNRISQLATGDLFFFTDANSDIDADCLRRVVKRFADARVGCVTGVEETVGERDRGAISLGGGTYLHYESLVNALESRIGSVLVCDGSIFCIRHDLYTELSPELANDFELPLRIGQAGFWLLFEPSARSREYATFSAREEFARRKRICGQGILGLWKLREHVTGIRAWQFLSRKCLRWFSLVPFCMVFASSIALARDPWFAALLIAQIVFLGLAASGWHAVRKRSDTNRIASLCFYFVLANLGAMTGVLETLLGRRFAVWDIARLSRGRQSTA